jgi:hypothetical protein
MLYEPPTLMTAQFTLEASDTVSEHADGFAVDITDVNVASVRCVDRS